MGSIEDIFRSWLGIARRYLIGRALSVSAMDCAINRLPKVRELKYQTPVTVADYHKAFFMDEVMCRIAG